MSNTPSYLPTPAEIAAATAKIRATWSEDERRRRAAFTPLYVRGGREGWLHRIPAVTYSKPKPYQFPIVAESDLGLS